MAGFVGTSNLLTGEAARAIVGTRRARSPSGPRRSTSPRPAPSAADDEVAADGTIREVVYVGPDTRYIVPLDAGAELVVTQQNLRTTSTEALAQQGRAVRLIWKRQHCLPVADGGAACGGGTDRMKQPRILARRGAASSRRVAAAVAHAAPAAAQRPGAQRAPASEPQPGAPSTRRSARARARST